VSVSETILKVQRLVPGLVERTEPKTATVSLPAAPDQPKFSDMVTDLLQSVNGVQNEAAAIQQAYLAGEEVELHQMMIKAEEAGISMDLLLEIRNRLVDAYNDLMKMPM
jgi:flagellar hook-basal body complex protein FliE